MAKLFAVDFQGGDASGIYRLEKIYCQATGRFLPEILASLTSEISLIRTDEIAALQARAESQGQDLGNMAAGLASLGADNAAMQDKYESLAGQMADLENVKLAAVAQSLANLQRAFELFLDGEPDGGDIDRLSELVAEIAANRTSLDALVSAKANQADLVALANRVTPLEKNATQSASGLMSASDKAKLDGIAAGATNTEAPPQAATEAPKAHGTAAVGASAKYAREDHVHPSNNTDTHWTSHLYVGTGTGNANAVTANGATYLILCDNSTVRDRRLIRGTGSVTVASDPSGNITINGTDTNTTYGPMTGASITANGEAGLVPAPAAGTATRYLRSDGTWQVPPDSNTTYGAATQAAAGLMSAADKVKLDGIAAGAQVNPNMALYLALTGGTMTGRLTIQMAGNSLILKNPDDVRASATTAQRWTYIEYVDKNGARIGSLVHGHSTAGLANTYIETYGQNNAGASIGVQIEANGVASGYCPNPPVSDSSNKMATTSWSIPKAQNRGTPAGYETVSSLSNSQIININSADCINLATSGAVTLTFTAAAATQRAIKVLCLTASAATTLTISGAVWANNGSAPTWGDAGKILVLLAHFVGGRVVLSVVDNTQ